MPEPFVIPHIASPATDQRGALTKPWRDFFLRLAAASDSAQLASELTALAERVTRLEEGDDLSALILGLGSVRVFGTLESGAVRIQLENDAQAPGVTYFYGTGPTGTRGWHRLYDGLTAGEGIAITDSGYTVLGEVDTPADLPGTGNTGEAWRVLDPAGLYAWDGAAFTLDPNATGIVGFALEPLPDTGVGAELVKLTRDAYGRLEGTEAATTDDLPEGSTNLYFTNARADARIEAQKGQPLGLATLDANSKLDAGQLPALAITETFVVNTEAAMLALDCQQGDVAVRSDLQASFILTAEPASTLSNWQELLVPTGVGVASFNGRTGTVLPATGDYTPAQVGADSVGSAAAAQSAAQTYADGKVVSTITNGDTTHAPSGDAVFDALALKANDNSVLHTTGNETASGVKTLTNDLVVQRSGVPSQDLTVTVDVFGATLSAHSPPSNAKPYVFNATTDIANTAPTSGAVSVDFATLGVTRWQVTGLEIQPRLDNTYAVGAASRRPSVIYAATGAINTSDAREKTPVAPLDDAEVSFAKQLAGEIGTFQWLEMIKQKGAENARHHVGVTVQRCIKLAQAHGLDPFRYAFICYDEWAETPEQWEEWPEEQDADGNVIREAGRELVQEYRPAGNRYSLRHDQLALFLARGFDARLKALEG